MYRSPSRVSFIYLNKIVLYILWLLVVLILLRSIKVLHTESWYSLPIRIYSAEKVAQFKYILLWTNSKNVPFSDMGEGQKGFISRNCSYTNCIVTANRSLLGDYRLFDVIAFHGPELDKMEDYEFPRHRSLQQKYVFASIESSANYPLCSDRYDGYFNWTWTYRLESEVHWGYIVIRDSKNQIIGPKEDMNWLSWSEMQDISDKMKERLRTKTKAAAWFVSNCQSRSHREVFVMALQRYLRKYNLIIDIYGSCGNFNCPREKKECVKMIENDYYFYLSFENAFSEDYVTEKLIIPLQNNAIPIVYGGANYTRFLPNGSYLNARELGLRALGDKMNELIQNPEKYAEYFKWKNHYSYHRMAESIETNEYCQMCALMNDNEAITKLTVYENIREWWDPANADC